MDSNTLQIATLIVNVVLAPLLGSVLMKLDNVQRRLSFIEGKLSIKERAEP